SADTAQHDKVAPASRLAAGTPGHPRKTQHRPVPVGLHPGAEELDRLRLEARLLEQLAAEAVEWVLALVEEAAGEVPEAGGRIVRTAAEQHASVLLHPRLRSRHRLRTGLER